MLWIIVASLVVFVLLVLRKAPEGPSGESYSQQDMRFILLFDGVCNFCNHSVQFVFRNDKHRIFFFQPTQSRKGQEILHQYKHLNAPTDLSTIILLDQKDQKIYIKADAVAQICRHLRFPWPFVYYLRLLVPTFVANFMYTTFGAKRYALFGKKDQCAYLPALKNRFLVTSHEWVGHLDVAGQLCDEVPCGKFKLLDLHAPK